MLCCEHGEETVLCKGQVDKLGSKAHCTPMRFGMHLPGTDLIKAAHSGKIEVAQTFISNPKSYTPAVANTRWGAIGDAMAEAGVGLYIHAPYLVNVVSANEDVRKRSVENLTSQMVAAEQIGAAGVVVHAGQGGKTGNMDQVLSWWEHSWTLNSGVTLLIENTAGGLCAPGKNLPTLAELVTRLRNGGANVGVCIDTCHAHAGGQTVDDINELGETLGGIDLFHLNDSKDAFSSSRDRHQNFGTGQLDLVGLRTLLTCWPDTPGIVETPGPAAAQLADITWLRKQVAA